ncbi:MAG: DDE-type integrase/transposase/recombinase [Synechococcus sp.]
MKISELSTEGKTDPEIAIELDIGFWVVRKWRRWFQKQGRTGLISKMGRPSKGALSTFSPELRKAICRIRKAHPGWGADSILVSLRLDEGWDASELPSRSRVAFLLKQEGLTRPYKHQSPLLQPKPQPVEHPHQEWQLDAKGKTTVAGVGSISLINITDVFSRLKVESYPSQNRRNPSTADYQLTLRRAFLEFGLPGRVTFDHGTAFCDNTSPSPWPTRLHLWLLALGIEVSFTRKRCPTDHAKIERMHRTTSLQALEGQKWSDSEALWDGLDYRREMLNHHLPVRTLNGQAPLMVYPEAAHSQHPYRPEWEEQMLQMERVYQYLDSDRWFRRTAAGGWFLLGGSSYQTDWKWRERTLEIEFDAQTLELICHSERETNDPLHLPLQGLNKADLMGEMSEFQRMPDFQLSMPWSRKEWRAIAYAELLAA